MALPSAASSSFLDRLAPDVLARALACYSSPADLGRLRGAAAWLEQTVVAALREERRRAGVAATSVDWRFARFPATPALLADAARRRARSGYDSGDEHDDERPAAAMRYADADAGVVRWGEGRITRRRVRAVYAVDWPVGVRDVELYENDFASRHAVDDFVDLLRSPAGARVEILAMADCALDAGAAKSVLDALRPSLLSLVVVVAPAPSDAELDAIADALERLAARAPRLAYCHYTAGGAAAASHGTDASRAPPRLRAAFATIRARHADADAPPANPAADVAAALAPLAELRDADGAPLFAHLAAELEDLMPALEPYDGPRFARGPS